MNPYGSSAKCPTCDKNVYAAEQVIGPGRMMYHKLCLKCVSCSRRLDSFSLREHDFQPYCNNCHVRNFGTRDLRSANVIPSSSSTGPLSPHSPRRARSQPPGPKSPSAAEFSIPEESPEFVEDAISQVPQNHEAEATPEGDETIDSVEGVIPSFDSYPAIVSPSELMSRNGIARSPSPLKRPFSSRPLSPNSTGASTASAPAPTYLRSNLTGTPLRPSFTGNLGTMGKKSKTLPVTSAFGGSPSCPRCDKVVYFAEQVKAAGRTWHKNCLRCTECSTLLNSSRITEKDGEVICRSCYSKLHGPIGGGYGLIGRIG